MAIDDSEIIDEPSFVNSRKRFGKKIEDIMVRKTSSEVDYGTSDFFYRLKKYRNDE